MSKKIGVLTSGGDCAGLNAVLRAVTLRAIHGYGWEVYGIRQGSHGLLERPVSVMPLTVNQFAGGVMRWGGTMLGTTNRGNPFAYPMGQERVDRSDEIIEGFKMLGLDALIGIGGDGSLAILRRLCSKGEINFVGIPKTIDNDIGLTERSIGFATAVNIATEAIDRLQPTAASHNRVMVLEVMGRDAGHIALSAGIAGGADVILIPEVGYSMDVIAQKIQSVLKTEKNFALVVVAEAVADENNANMMIADFQGKRRYGGIGHYMAERLQEVVDAETRFTVLGHVQRGCEPNAEDRLLASAFGVHAVDLIAQGKFGRMVAWQDRRVTDVDLGDAMAYYQGVRLDDALIQTARGLGICLGDR